MEWLTAVSILLGVGTCDGSKVDYCPDPVGEVAIEVEAARYNNHSILFKAVHYSEIGNGEPYGGDRGTELYLLEYKYTWRLK